MVVYVFKYVWDNFTVIKWGSEKYYNLEVQIKWKYQTWQCSLFFSPINFVIGPVYTATGSLVCTGQYFIFFKVTGLNTDAGQMAASISRQLSALKCGVKAGTCQYESHLSPCAFSSDSETDTGSPQRDRHQIPSYSLQSTCPVWK